VSSQYEYLQDKRSTMTEDKAEEKRETASAKKEDLRQMWKTGM
jgi:hypothetical protein